MGAFGLAVLTTVGLVVIAWRGLRAGPAVERALDEGLGSGWRTSIDTGMAARLRRRLPLARILFGPFLVRRRDVERVANIRYGDAGKRNLLDVYRHRSRLTGGPTLVYMHGGGFVSGGKDREARPLLYRLASQGWVCVSANYRLRPAARFPDHLIDVKKVIAWVREHGREYGVSSQPVVYAELPGTQHSFDLFHSLRFAAVIKAIEAFTAWVRSPVRAGRRRVRRVRRPCPAA